MTQATAPLPRPAYGIPTIRWVLDAIKANPELHNQDQWEFPTECGTAMCVAGWAAFLHNDLLDHRLAHMHRLPAESEPGRELEVYEARCTEIPLVGRETMRLSWTEGQWLFYNCNNQQAVAALEILAEGGKVNWEEICRDDS